jgi:AraC family transcriptional regulator of arabinose operon
MAELRFPYFGRSAKPEGFAHQRIVALPQGIVGAGRAQLLLRGLLPTSIGFFPAAKGHLLERPGGAEQTVFIYCLKGKGWCEMRERRHEVSAGSLLVVPAGESHAYGADAREPWTIAWFHAVGEDIPPLLAELGMGAECPIAPLSEDLGWMGLFEGALATLEHGYTKVHLLHASRCLGHLVGATIWDRQRHRPNLPDPRQNVLQCVEFMKQQLDQPLRLTHLAAMANLSLSHFKALFREYVGYSCIDYFIRLRMHRACQLLDTTELSIKSIAGQVGYADPLWFSKSFRGITGMPPTEYRRKRKG